MGSYGSLVAKGATGLVLTVLLCLALGWMASEQRAADVRRYLIAGPTTELVNRLLAE